MEKNKLKRKNQIVDFSETDVYLWKRTDLKNITFAIVGKNNIEKNAEEHLLFRNYENFSKVCYSYETNIYWFLINGRNEKQPSE